MDDGIILNGISVYKQKGQLCAIYMNKQTINHWVVKYLSAGTYSSICTISVTSAHLINLFSPVLHLQFDMVIVLFMLLLLNSGKIYPSCEELSDN